jgi:hypothetical protein
LAYLVMLINELMHWSLFNADELPPLFTT